MDAMKQQTAGYVVLMKTADAAWTVKGEVDRRPGMPARKSRAQAIRDVLGRNPLPTEAFAVLPRSEWRLAQDY